MVIAHQHNSALLSRLLSLKDSSRFILITDSIAQSSDYFILELYHRVPADAVVILLSFETLTYHKRINQVVDCHRKPLAKIVEEVIPLLDKTKSEYGMESFDVAVEERSI